MTSHLDADVLADYREGLLGQRRSGRIRAHLAGCPQCSSLDAGLAEVTELLASAPTPPMPDHLVTRLENALAVEAAVRASTAAAGGQVTAGQVTAGQVTDAATRAAGTTTGQGDEAGAAGTGPGGPGRWQRLWRGQAGSGRPRQWRTAMLGAAAVLVLILAVGGVYGLARVMSQGTSSSGGAAESAGRPAFSGNSHESPAARQPAVLPTGSLPVTHSGTDYQPGTLASQADSTLGRKISSRTLGGSASLTPGRASGANSSSSQAVSPQLQACVALVTGGAAPRLVDVARYQGRSATIIVQAAASGQSAQVWVVGPGCSATGRDLIAHTQLTSGS